MKTKRSDKRTRILLPKENPPVFHNHNLELVILSASVFGFLASFDGDFVFDDAESIVRNPVVNGKVALAEIWTRDFWGTPMSSAFSHKSYRPLTTLTFWMNYQMGGLNTQGYHLINICLHALVSWQIFNLSQRITSVSLSFLSALLFAAHPIHAEAVANITGRAEVLMAAFFLCGLKCYLDERNIFLVLLSATLSVLSKEQGIMLLPFLCVLEVWNCKAETKKRSLKNVVLFITSTIGLLYWRLWMNNFSSPTFTESDNAASFVKDPTFRYINYCYLWTYNLFLLVNPVSLCFDYSMGCIPTINLISDLRVLSPICILLLTALLVYWCRLLEDQQQRLVLFGVVLGAMTFLPSSNIFVRVGFTVAERVLYLPSLGFCMLASVVVDFFGKKHCNHDVLVGIFVLAAISLSHQRSLDWRSELRLYESGLRVCPNNAKIHYNLGKVLSDSGRIVEAQQSYEKAIRLNQRYDSALNNLGNIREQQGRYLEAEELLQKAVSIRPSFATAWMNLGIAKMHLDKFEESHASFSKSLKIRPNSAECYYNLGNLFHKMNTTYSALDAWSNATRLDPTLSSAWVNHFVLLDELDRCDTVVSLAELAITHSSHPAIHFQVGSCMGRLGIFKESESHLRKALEMKPQSSLYHANLGVLYQRWKRYSEAEAAYLKALSIDPNIEGILENLQSVRSKIGNRTRAIQV